MWRQAGKRTNNNLMPETRTHSSGGEKKKVEYTREWRKKELLLVISRTEHIVIRRWQRDEMCEVGKRRWQEKGTHPVTTSKTTANGDRVLINSSHIHVHNEGKFVYRHHIARAYISTVSHSDDFSIYKPSPGLLANGKMFCLKDKHSEKIFVGGSTEISCKPLGNILDIQS